MTTIFNSYISWQMGYTPIGFFLGKLSYFTHLNLAAIKGDHFPYKNHDSQASGEQASVVPHLQDEFTTDPIGRAHPLGMSHGTMAPYSDGTQMVPHSDLRMFIHVDSPKDGGNR